MVSLAKPSDRYRDIKAALKSEARTLRAKGHNGMAGMLERHAALFI